MDHVPQRSQSGNRASPGPARAEHAGHFLKAESLTLEYDQGLDLGILEREAFAEEGERFTVDADESGRWIAHVLAQNRSEDRTKELDA